MSTPYLGEIRAVGFDFQPIGWRFCNGQLLAIDGDTDALFQLIGTNYGGDGINNFGLPDLRGRSVVGGGPGYPFASFGGTETVTLIQNQMANHTHAAQAHVASPANAADPGAAVWGVSTTATYAGTVPAVPTTAATPGSMAFDAIGFAGGSQPHDNQPPVLVINYIIAIFGIFPTQS